VLALDLVVSRAVRVIEWRVDLARRVAIFYVLFWDGLYVQVVN
jgi:hypothetical protein